MTELIVNSKLLENLVIILLTQGSVDYEKFDKMLKLSLNTKIKDKFMNTKY